MNLKVCTLALLILVISNSYAKTVAPKSGAIYGSDDRSFITNNTPTTIKEMATGIAFIVSSEYWRDYKDGTSLIYAQELSKIGNVCKEQKFAKNLAIANCTGFLVNEDTLVTAGHCIKDTYDCRDKKFVFGVNQAKETSSGYYVPTNNVYNCKEVVSRMDENGVDYAVIKLNKKVPHRHIFKLSSSDVKMGTSVYMLGHGAGQVVSFSGVGSVSYTKSEYLFGAQLDSFSGNSGSPVINTKTNEVEGILVGGNEDWKLNESRGCNEYLEYSGSTSEAVFRIKHLFEFLD